MARRSSQSAQLHPERCYKLTSREKLPEFPLNPKYRNKLRDEGKLRTFRIGNAEFCTDAALSECLETLEDLGQWNPGEGP